VLLTFFEKAWFQTHGREVVWVLIPNRLQASTLNNTAATCEHTSPKLQDVM